MPLFFRDLPVIFVLLLGFALALTMPGVAGTPPLVPAPDHTAFASDEVVVIQEDELVPEHQHDMEEEEGGAEHADLPAGPALVDEIQGSTPPPPAGPATVTEGRPLAGSEKDPDE
jgi:hypothetical protein